MAEFTITSSLQTKKIAFALAREILKMPPAKNALIIALEGNLGAGKTTFVQGFAKGLDIQEIPKSPTFVLMNVYPVGKIQISKSKIQKQKNLKTYKHLVHLDCYRVASARELLHLGIKEIFKDPHSVVLIEWAERIRRLLPKDAMRIRFRYGKHAKERRLEFKMQNAKFKRIKASKFQKYLRY